ncbi:hypothetical protein [Aurantibacillus circumpalustris]|uniref:hypothetical protein n=1 Tax=Aurantibacillus circumpalustris TaxID=3036359 RepID=UPI00295B6F7F|nr:hypothetical protein [Aurantibacillus circumpalustris]
MKAHIHIFLIVFLASFMPTYAQTPTFEELDFEIDSVKTAYKAVGKNYAFIRSKKGTGGVNKNPLADAIVSAEVTEIVLVFSETESSDLAVREQENQERWENLLRTYPEYFQYSTSYKNLCQCNTKGDAEAFKKVQGFYIYIEGALPKVALPVEEESAPVAKTVKAEEKAAAPAKEAVAEKPMEKAAPAKESVKETPKAAVKETPKETVKETVKETPVVAAVEQPVEENEPAEEEVKAAPKKKPAVAKIRRAKDPKACRPPCYQSGDEDLNAFFKDQITLTKKQKRQGKNLICNVRIQLNLDGTIKKTFVMGQDEVLNQQVTGALTAMNPWNAAVKAGATVKSEVKFNLKFDKETKSLKPADMLINPRPSPKCKCMSDDEIFGSD